jgi:hypothetical protein
VADPIHLEKLCEGPKAWNAWRDTNPNIIPDLTEIRLTLAQRQLGPATGGPVDLGAADLEHASLPYATLSGANLEGARLVGADLTHARLDGAKLAGADLTDAVLDQADLTGAVLDHAVLFGTQLSNTRNLTAAQIEQAYGDASTRLPVNLLPPDSWFPTGDFYDDDDYAGWGTPAPYEEEPRKNLYELLDLTQGATPEEIRTSYRNLVKKLHPDLNPNDQKAQESFKQVTTAYRILNDSAQRQRYDRGEIDGDGRANPEFEANRRFRRAAFRYYAAAAGSFLLAAGALAAVWHTVLSISPVQEEVVTVSQPKNNERLGFDASSPPKPAETEQNASLDVKAAGPESPTPARSDVAAAKPVVAAPNPEQTTPQAGDNPPPEATKKEPETPGDSAAVAPRSPDQSLSRSTQAEILNRPLFRPHKEAAGKTAPFAPDGWSVAALPSGPFEYKSQSAASVLGVTSGGQKVSPSPQPFARDIVSQVLRVRAFQQALGKRRPVTAGELPALPEHRADSTPTSAAGTPPANKSRAVPLKRSVVSQRKPQASARQARPQATASISSFQEQ